MLRYDLVVLELAKFSQYFRFDNLQHKKRIKKDKDAFFCFLLFGLVVYFTHSAVPLSILSSADFVINKKSNLPEKV